MHKYNFIDIFSGCGGLTEGFEKNGNYKMLAAVEWEKPQVENLRNRLKSKWSYSNAEECVMQFDIQRTDELIYGWENDKIFGSHKGLDALVNNQHVDLIIGGPPCQAYSLAGRIRDVEGMRDDYRNYLFESYLKIVKKYQPDLFVFENVQGMLSARPGGREKVTNLIKKEIEATGYSIVEDLKTFALLDLSQFGIPQKRKRVIIIGIRNSLYPNAQRILKNFYSQILLQYKEPHKTVADAILDLPKLYPLNNRLKILNRRMSHTDHNINGILNHIGRYHNERDIQIFKLLTSDIETNKYEFISSKALKELYTKMTGKTSNIHKYYVLRWNEPSNTIPAHLNKDGLRHIHPDSNQARSITVREAARLQTFDDDYEFISSIGANYKMIGNAVPPKFSEKLADALLNLLPKLAHEE